MGEQTSRAGQPLEPLALLRFQLRGVALRHIEHGDQDSTISVMAGASEHGTGIDSAFGTVGANDAARNIGFATLGQQRGDRIQVGPIVRVKECSKR